MTVQTQPSAKQYAAARARVLAIRQAVTSIPGLIGPAYALGGLATHLLQGVLDRADAAPAGSTARLAAYAEMLAVPDLTAAP